MNFFEIGEMSKNRINVTVLGVYILKVLTMIHRDGRNQPGRPFSLCHVSPSDKSVLSVITVARSETKLMTGISYRIEVLFYLCYLKRLYILKFCYFQKIAVTRCLARML